MSTKSLRNAAIVAFVAAMAFLLVGGFFAVDKVPPIPEQVVTSDGTVAITREDIMAGQTVYQRYGLMDHGSIWGHGSLRGMDFSASTLHRLGESMRRFHREAGKDEAQVDAIVPEEIHTNRYDEVSGKLTITPAQAQGLEEARAYWDKVFRDGDERYGFLEGTVPTPEERKAVADFFFWTA